VCGGSHCWYGISGGGRARTTSGKWGERGKGRNSARIEFLSVDSVGEKGRYDEGLSSGDEGLQENRTEERSDNGRETTGRRRRNDEKTQKQRKQEERRRKGKERMWSARLCGKRKHCWVGWEIGWLVEERKGIES
jgi:hypothetical protein